MMDTIAKEESSTVLPTLMSELNRYQVTMLTSAKLSEIKENCVIVEKSAENEAPAQLTIPSDFVVMAVGARKNVPDLTGCPLPLHYVGDCAGDRPSNIEHAIKSAYEVANAI